MARSKGARSRAGLARSALQAVLFIFILDTLFDPADLLLHLKVPLYAACWLAGVVVCFTRKEETRISYQLLLYCLLMVTLPLLSIVNFQIVDGSDRFEGYSMLKAYIFISIAMLLFITRTDLLPLLSRGLTILALFIFALTALVLWFPILFLPVYTFGQNYQIFGIDSRDYGGLVMFQMFFVTSSMLVFGVAYYFDKAWKSRRKLHWLLMAMCSGGMIVAGTRNNIAVAIIVPLALTFAYAKRKILISAILGVLVLGGVIAVFDQLKILLSPVEHSNQVKINMLNDYAAIFQNPVNLWIGRGLGAYDQWTGRGENFITELTYLEIFRNYGLLMGTLMLLLLLYPLIYGFIINRGYTQKHILMAYAMYLLMSATNPLLFSSPGILALSIVLANIFIYRTDRAAARRPGSAQ